MNVVGIGTLVDYEKYLTIIKVVLGSFVQKKDVGANLYKPKFIHI